MSWSQQNKPQAAGAQGGQERVGVVDGMQGSGMKLHSSRAEEHSCSHSTVSFNDRHIHDALSGILGASDDDERQLTR